MKLKALSYLFAAAAFAAPFAASAVPLFPVYTVTPGAALQGTLTTFKANDLGGQYRETFTFTSATTFNVSALFLGNNFNLDDTVLAHTYTPAESGLGVKYQLYAQELATGTYSTSGSTTTFQITSGSFTLYLDPFAISGLMTGLDGFPANGSTLSPRTDFGDDIPLGTGTLIPAGSSGTQTCTGGNNCGSFGQTAKFSLTAAGSSFFTAPVPFYNLALTSGQFQGVNPVNGQNANSTGTANTVFAVPEPSGIALMGLALLSLGFSRRRKDQV